MTDLLEVTTATADRAAAVVLAGEAVRRRLAASAQVRGPVLTAFWHLGEFGEGEEWHAVLMVTAAGYPALESFLLAHHPWDNPQVTAVSVTAAAAGYADWVHRALAAG